MSRMVLLTACIPLDKTKPIEWHYWPLIGIDDQQNPIVLKNSTAHTILRLPSYNFEVEEAMTRIIDTHWCQTVVDEANFVKSIVRQWAEQFGVELA